PAWLWLAAWCLLLAVQIITPLWYPTPDACAYLSIARSLAATARPTNLGDTYLMFPLGYPSLISPLFLVGGCPFLALTLLHAALSGLYLAGTYVWVRKHAPEAALPIALLAVGNVLVLGILRRALSEAAFLPLMIWLVNALGAIPRSRTVWRPLLGAGVLLGLLVAVRQAGIFFAAGFGLQMLLSARRGLLTWRRACGLTLAVGLPGALALAGVIGLDHLAALHQGRWSPLNILFRSSAHLPSDFADRPVGAQCLEGLRIRISEVGRLLLPGMFNSYGKDGDWWNLNLLLYLPLVLLVALGWFRFARQRLDVFALTVPLYVALYVYWPFNQSARFFVPLLPMLYLCLWWGLERLGQRRRAVLQVLLGAHMVVALGYWLAIDRPRALADARRWQDLQQVAALVRAEPGTLQTTSELGNSYLLLAYLLDQPVSQQFRGQPVDARVSWLVDAIEAPPRVGFQPFRTVGPYRLLRRVPVEVSDSPRSPAGVVQE
ncbi:MAG: hypothetical protein JO112_03480, partial [Planctomycetes bacterium]|nr:hypothetical protein [Planctomycetota bacterium]